MLPPCMVRLPDRVRHQLLRNSGVVVRWHAAEGWGLLRADKTGETAVAKRSQLVSGGNPKSGTAVEFDLHSGPKGGEAKNVTGLGGTDL